MLEIELVEALYKLLNLEDIKLYLDKEEVPVKNFEENRSIGAVYPKDGIVFLDIYEIHDKIEFFTILCSLLYQIKLNKSKVTIYEQSKYCDAFTYYIMNIIFGYEVSINKDEFFEDAFEHIQKEYPKDMIIKIIQDSGFVIEEINFKKYCMSNVYFIYQ